MSEPITRSQAITLLRTGSDAERIRALRAIAYTGGDEAVPGVIALLLDANASDAARSFAADTLATLDAVDAAPSIGNALRDDPVIDVRVACAQALARLHGGGVVDALSQAVDGESDESVRIEIVHALGSQGITASDALTRIAGGDNSHHVRELARGYLMAVR